MPYISVAEAKNAGFPTHAEDIALTLKQINKLAEIYDAVKAAGTAKNAMAVAWTSWKKLYKKEGDKWVLAKKEGEHETNKGNWIPVAKKDQEKSLEDGKTIILTEEALINSLGTWKDGNIYINHEEAIPGIHILDDKYEAPFLYMLFDRGTEKLFRNTDTSGWSIQLEPDSIQFDGNKIIDGSGMGVSLLYPDHYPTCTPDMGCQETYTFEMKRTEVESFEGKNESEIKSIGDEMKKGFERLLSLLKGVTLIKTKKEEYNQEQNLDKKEDMEKVEELTSQLSTATAELTKVKGEFETVKADHDTEVKELKEKIAEFEQEKTDAKKVEMDAQWEQLKKEVIPPGLTAKDEDVEALKAEFEQHPHEFIKRMSEFEKHEEQKEEGAEFEGEKNEDVASIKKLKEDTGRV